MVCFVNRPNEDRIGCTSDILKGDFDNMKVKVPEIKEFDNER